jgi:hypothetical protein
VPENDGFQERCGSEVLCETNPIRAQSQVACVATESEEWPRGKTATFTIPEVRIRIGRVCDKDRIVVAVARDHHDVSDAS